MCVSACVRISDGVIPDGGFRVCACLPSSTSSSLSLRGTRRGVFSSQTRASSAGQGCITGSASPVTSVGGFLWWGSPCRPPGEKPCGFSPAPLGDKPCGFSPMECTCPLTVSFPLWTMVLGFGLIGLQRQGFGCKTSVSFCAEVGPRDDGVSRAPCSSCACGVSRTIPAGENPGLLSACP